MEPDSFHLRFEGPPENRRKAQFDEFVDFCREFDRVLENTIRCVAGRSNAVVFDIEELSIGSARMGLVPRVNGKRDFRRDVMGVVYRTAEKLHTGSFDIDERLDAQAINAYRLLGRHRSLGKQQKQKRTASINGIPIDETFVATAEALLEVSSISYGSVSGRLQKVDLHKHLEFAIFPPADRHEIKCSFDGSLFDVVQTALSKTVTVYGKLHYSERRAFPTYAEVDEIEIHPDVNKIPKLSEMREYRPQSVDSVSAVRAIRNEYE